MAGNRLIFETGIDGTGFTRGLNNIATGALSSFKNTVLGAFGVFSVGQAVKGTIEWASKLQDSADALGVNVEWLQKMQNGAKLVGGDIEDITKMILEMNKSRQAALLNPTGKESLAFERSGMTRNDIQNLSTGDFVQKFVESFKSGVTTQGANDIQEVGGRSARNLIAAFANQFASDTPILSQELINQLDDIGDQFTSLSTQLKVSLAPAILYVMQLLKRLSDSTGQLGAGLGGASVAEQPAKEVKGLGDWFKRYSGYEWWANTWKGAQKAVVSAEADQQNAADEIEIAKKAEKSVRAAREKAAPSFSLEGIKLDKQKADGKQTMPSSDALVSVGNFLGTNRGTIETLAQRQVDLLQTISANTNNTWRSLERAINSTGGDTIYPIA